MRESRVGETATLAALPTSARASLRRLRRETPVTLPVMAPIPTLTERQLSAQSIEEIVAEFGEGAESQSPLIRYLPFLMDVVAAESEKTFGYHGASQEVRLFQDALRLIFEEVLGVFLPEDFYFLRIPGEEFLFETDNVKKEFLESRSHLDQELQAFALDFFILRDLNEGYGLSLTPGDFSPEAVKEIEPFIISRLKANVFNSDNPFDLSVSVLSMPPVLSGEIGFLYNLSMGEVYTELNQQLSKKYLFGAFEGYLQEKFDVVRMPISQVGEKGWDEYLARSIECQNLISEWMEFCYFFGDTNAEGSSKVISIVGSLFGGLEPGGTGESALLPFLYNGSYEMHDMRLKFLLERFCQSLGMPAETGKKLMEAGRKILYEGDIEEGTGVLFQFYDISSDRVVDRVTYLTQNDGQPIHRAQKINTSSYIKGDLNPKEPVEIRLIMDNSTTLDPNGSIRMVRYDGLPEGSGKAILDALRDVIREARVDPLKVEEYQAKLKEYWLRKLS